MSLPAADSKHSHLDRLDVLRALAIILVFLYHYYKIVRDSISPSSDANRLWGPILSWGMNGVPLFFLISGFCIHYGFLRGGSTVSVGQFYWRRFSRIYPAYLASLLIFTFLGIAKLMGDVDLTQFIVHLFLIHNFFPPAIYYGICGPYWSLAVEFQFYLLYPLLLILRARIGLKTCCALAFGLAIVYELLMFRFPFIREDVSNPTIAPDWYSWILGACLAEAFTAGRTLFPWGCKGLTLIAILMVILQVSTRWYFAPRLATFLFFGALLENYLALKGPLAWWERALAPIGVISYSIYLWHDPVISLVYGGIRPLLSLPHTFAMQMSFYLVPSLLVVGPLAFASYILCEKEAMNWLRRWGRRKTPALRKRASSKQA